jgi:thiamine-phosphate pyrophosphorylase
MKNIGVFHVITDTTTQTRLTHYQLAEMAIKGGADTIQFRQKTGTTRQLVELCKDFNPFVGGTEFP